MRILLLATTFGVFVGGCALTAHPVWRLMEQRNIRDISGDPPDHFPVLVHSKAPDTGYAIAWYAGLASETPVTAIAAADLPAINQALARSVADDPEFAPRTDYFQLLEQTDHRLDVSLEVPTSHESMNKGWYRIENGRIIPQKILRYGPGFAFLVLPFNLSAGFLAALAYYWAISRWRKAPLRP